MTEESSKSDPYEILEECRGLLEGVIESGQVETEDLDRLRLKLSHAFTSSAGEKGLSLFLSAAIQGLRNEDLEIDMLEFLSSIFDEILAKKSLTIEEGFQLGERLEDHGFRTYP